MPRKTKATAAADKRRRSRNSQPTAGATHSRAGNAGRTRRHLQQFKKSVLERALGAEISHHLGYAPGQAEASKGLPSDHRNGKSAKTVLTNVGALRMTFPATARAHSSPSSLASVSACFTGFNDSGSPPCTHRHDGAARSRASLAEMYSVDVSPDLISSVTDAVMSEVCGLADAPARAHVPGRLVRRAAGQEDVKTLWCAPRPCIWRWPCLPDGSRDILGISDREHRGAPVLRCCVFNDLKTRGVRRHPDLP